MLKGWGVIILITIQIKIAVYRFTNAKCSLFIKIFLFYWYNIFTFRKHFNFHDNWNWEYVRWNWLEDSINSFFYYYYLLLKKGTTEKGIISSSLLYSTIVEYPLCLNFPPDKPQKEMCKQWKPECVTGKLSSWDLWVFCKKKLNSKKYLFLLLKNNLIKLDLSSFKLLSRWAFFVWFNFKVWEFYPLNEQKSIGFQVFQIDSEGGYFSLPFLNFSYGLLWHFLF